MSTEFKKTILVIEDDPGISMAVRDELEFEGFRVEVAHDGRAGLESILQSPPHLVVLDIMLPGQNGFQICKEVRARGIATPIIVLTARGQEADRVRGLELGADDYITKPFSLAELVARVRAVLRRYDPQDRADTIRHGPITIDFRKRQLLKGNAVVELTDKEFQILGLLMKRPSEVISRDDFLKTLWGDDVYVTPRTIDIHISSLRKKIEDDPENPSLIVSVRNAGYKFSTT
jgi:DNA-binding response OmpR family regulator